MTDEQIKYMVDRFLGWTLPENFNPDGGISFRRLENRYHHPEASPFYPMPSGTNLLDAQQATEMVRHIVNGLPSVRGDAEAAALSAATALPASPATAAAAGDVVAPSAITPLKAKPYTDYVWEWFVSHDGCTYYEGFPTKEEAMQYAQQSDYSLIAECVQQDFRLDVDADRVLEDLNESNYDLIGEGEGIEATAEQLRDLEDMLTRTLEAWVVKHGINITAWSFDGTRNKTDVPLPAAS